MERYFDNFDTQIQCEELENPEDNFDWDDYYVDSPEKIVDDSDLDPGYVDLDWLYEELNTYEIDGDF